MVVTTLTETTQVWCGNSTVKICTATSNTATINVLVKPGKLLDYNLLLCIDPIKVLHVIHAIPYGSVEFEETQPVCATICISKDNFSTKLDIWLEVWVAVFLVRTTGLSDNIILAEREWPIEDIIFVQKAQTSEDIILVEIVWPSEDIILVGRMQMREDIILVGRAQLSEHYSCWESMIEWRHYSYWESASKWRHYFCWESMIEGRHYSYWESANKWRHYSCWCKNVTKWKHYFCWQSRGFFWPVSRIGIYLFMGDMRHICVYTHTHTHTHTSCLYNWWYHR